jgi:hypothetical protein
MPSNNSLYRDIGSALFYLISALGCFAFAGWMIYLLLVPGDRPVILKQIDAWSSAHPKDIAGIAVMLIVGGLGWAMTSFQTETHNKLNALEKQLSSIAEDLAEIKSDLHDLDRKI